MHYPIYANEMFPPVPGAPQQGYAPAPQAFNPFALAAMQQAAMQPQQTAIMGLEMVGNELDHLLAMSGAAAYGAAAYGSGMEMVGALPARMSQPPWMQQAGHHPHHPHAHGGHQFGRGVDVSMQAGTHVRRQSLGLATPAAVAAAGGTGVASAQPQIPFRPEKLVVPSDFGGSFDITDCKVGKDSQFVAPGAVPARAFDEKAVDNLLSFHACAISQIISVSVVNNAGVAQVFKCYMTGTSVE